MGIDYWPFEIREGARTIGPLISAQTSLQGGGYLVLGQRQQSQKQFIEAKAFVGEISHVNIWSEKRTDFDVIRKDCVGLPVTGNVFHLSDDTIDLHQSASIIASDACSGILLLSLLLLSIKTPYLFTFRKVYIFVDDLT